MMNLKTSPRVPLPEYLFIPNLSNTGTGITEAAFKFRLRLHSKNLKKGRLRPRNTAKSAVF